MTTTSDNPEVEKGFAAARGAPLSVCVRAFVCVLIRLSGRDGFAEVPEKHFGEECPAGLEVGVEWV